MVNFDYSMAFIGLMSSARNPTGKGCRLPRLRRNPFLSWVALNEFLPDFPAPGLGGRRFRKIRKINRLPRSIWGRHLCMLGNAESIRIAPG